MGEHTEDQRNAHGMSCTDVISYVAEDDGYNGTAAHGGNEEGSTALGVAAESAKRQGED
jgi:hypothetical protein